MVDIVLLDYKSGCKLGRLIVPAGVRPCGLWLSFRWLLYIVLPAVLAFLVRHRGKLVLCFGWS